MCHKSQPYKVLRWNQSSALLSFLFSTLFLDFWFTHSFSFFLFLLTSVRVVLSLRVYIVLFCSPQYYYFYCCCCCCWLLLCFLALSFFFRLYLLFSQVQGKKRRSEETRNFKTLFCRFFLLLLAAHSAISAVLLLQFDPVSLAYSFFFNACALCLIKLH